MKILILGAQGNLGTQLVNLYQDDELLAWDKDEADFLNLADLEVKLDIAKPKMIINAAAYNAVDNCESDSQELAIALKLNRDLPAFLADWCLRNQTVLIHYSTDYVFSGDESHQEFSENEPPNPINKYGASKAAGEAEIIKHSGLNYYLIRVSKLFGPRGSSPYAKNSFFDIMLGLAKDNSEFKVVDEEVSCFTYTPDLAKATKNLIEQNFPYGIYHLANSGACTWYESMLGLNLPNEVIPIKGSDLVRPAARPKFSALKNTKFPPLRDYREALKEYLNK
jgi:dTDP-4-dehydrorhamnose reductase